MIDELWEQATADHAACALRTARRLQVAFAELATKHSDIDAGVGMSSGTVVAGNLGAETRYEYTVIGAPVNEAARFTEEPRPGSSDRGGSRSSGRRASALAGLRPEDAPRQVERHPDLRTVAITARLAEVDLGGHV